MLLFVSFFIWPRLTNPDAASTAKWLIQCRHNRCSMGILIRCRLIDAFYTKCYIAVGWRREIISLCSLFQFLVSGVDHMPELKSSIIWRGIFVGLIFVSTIADNGSYLGLVGVICLSIIGLTGISSMLIILGEIQDQLISAKEKETNYPN